MDDLETDSDDDIFAPGSFRAVVYAAMLSAAIAGQLLGIGVDALLGHRNLVVPLALSVVLEAIAGARLGARSAGHPLGAVESARLSATYSAALVALSVPLAAWLSMARHAQPGEPTLWTPAHVGAALAAVAVGTAVRWALMLAFAPRSG